MFIATGTGEFGDEFEPETFAVGDEVTAKDGPFENFDGTVMEVDLSLSLAIVEIPIFGKHQRVPLRFHELKKREA
jgi:transcription termination/antitermination protein NusG